MKKRLISLFLALFLLFSVGSFSVAATENQFKKTPITGNFIQPFLYMGYSDKQMDQEFAKMAEYGMDTLILGGELAFRDNPNDEWDLGYPSKLPEFNQATSRNDYVSKLFKYCKKYGIKLYLGVGYDGDWWNRDLSKDADAKWLIDVCNISAKMVGEIYDLYAEEYGDAFGGYYWVYEIWNHNSWNNAVTRKKYAENLAAGFNIVLDAIKETDPSKPLIFSPFATRVGFATKENLTAFYTEFFKLVDFRSIDAMAPMDNIGGGGMQLPYLDEWTKAYSDAFKASGTKLQHWSNCESFVQPNDTYKSWTTCTMDRFVQQVEITSKYCSKIISFAYSHYMSPVNCLAGFDKAYLEYLRTGVLETTAPALPEKITVTEAFDGGKINITFDAFKDDYDIARYFLYRITEKGELKEVKQNLSVGRNGQNSATLLKSRFTSVSVPAGIQYFVLEAVDCSGNVSERCYIPVNGDDIENTSGFKTGEKGYYTQAEFDALTKEETSRKEPISKPVSEQKSEPASTPASKPIAPPVS
ncbi:MAG: DUF4434 domain-containing protein, partial [Oscillospiraceae bacterium]|nr:DUF4434 domain-containing protein [Oscillospiraceae bacterium]